MNSIELLVSEFDRAVDYGCASLKEYLRREKTGLSKWCEDMFTEIDALQHRRMDKQMFWEGHELYLGIAKGILDEARAIAKEKEVNIREAVNYWNSSVKSCPSGLQTAQGVDYSAGAMKEFLGRILASVGAQRVS